MSLLDEALERQLRKILPLPPKPAPAGPPVKNPKTGVLTPGNKNVTTRWHLVFDEGTSDKEYIIEVVLTTSGYDVLFEYGRRGRARQKGDKGTALSMSEAMRVARKIVAEKVGKGYREL